MKSTASEDGTIRLWHFRLNRDIEQISLLEKEQDVFNHDMINWQAMLNKIRKSQL